MKFNIRHIIVSLLLLGLLAVVVFVNISLFISGPKQKYDQDILDVETKIHKENKNIDNITRHAFSYVVYVGESENRYVWFDAYGDKLLHRDKDTYDEAKAASIAMSDYGFAKAKVSLGYGYKKPVYVIKDSGKELYLDYDSMKEIFYMEGL